MVAHTIRLALVALAAALCPISVPAQSPTPSQLRVPAPDRHPATGLVFPAEIAGAEKISSTDYGKGLGRPELGYSWNYQVGRSLSATVYVYQSAQTIPDGPSTPPVIAQFKRSLDEIRQAAQIKRYDHLKVTRGPTDCAYGRIVFRCITLSAVQNNQRIYTALMLTGYRDHFLKLRLDWPEGPEASQAAVDRFMQTLIGAIVR